MYKKHSVVKPRYFVFMAFLMVVLFFRIGLLPKSAVARTSLKRNSEFAYATLLSQHDDDSDYNHPGYLLTTRLIIRSIKKQTNRNADIIALVVPQTGQKTIKILEDEGAIVKVISPRDYTPSHRVGTLGRYEDQFAKLALWNMTEYSQIFFVDSDLMVKGDVTKLPSILPEGMEFGAVTDYGEVIYNGKWKRYFNGGMLVVKPSSARLDHMLSVMRYFDDDKYYDLAEQDFLNWYWGKTFFSIDPMYNLQYIIYEDIDWKLSGSSTADVDSAALIHFKPFSTRWHKYEFVRNNATRKINKAWENYIFTMATDLVTINENSGHVVLAEHPDVCIAQCNSLRE